MRATRGEILTDNDTAFCSRQFKCFLDEWGIQLRLRCAHVPTYNDIAERCHQNVKRITARKQCTVVEAVFRYNATPKDNVSLASTPDNGIHSYRVQIKEIDGVCLPCWREIHCPYSLPIAGAPPTSKWDESLVSILVIETPCHVKDLCLALEITPMASDSKRESSESELLIKPASRETNNSPENPTINQSESSSEEDI